MKKGCSIEILIFNSLNTAKSDFCSFTRQHLHQSDRDILNEYERINQVWADVDYASIAFYLGDKYAADLRKAEKFREEQRKRAYELRLRQALDFQRDDLLEKLRITQQDFLLGVRVGAAEMSHLLEISRAFVYSYFDTSAYSGDPEEGDNSTTEVL